MSRHGSRTYSTAEKVAFGLGAAVLLPVLLWGKYHADARRAKERARIEVEMRAMEKQRDDTMKLFHADSYQSQRFRLSGSPETDTDLELLAMLARMFREKREPYPWNFRAVNCDRSQVTDAGLAHLAGLECITTLSLKGSRVTDGGLPSLKTLPHLREVNLANTRVTEEAVRRLRSDLPKLAVER